VISARESDEVLFGARGFRFMINKCIVVFSEPAFRTRKLLGVGWCRGCGCIVGTSVSGRSAPLHSIRVLAASLKHYSIPAPPVEIL
jgi:hypothetical protein